MEITFTKEEAIQLLRESPYYSSNIRKMNGIDVLSEIGKKTPKEIISIILEAIDENKTDDPR